MSPLEQAAVERLDVFKDKVIAYKSDASLSWSALSEECETGPASVRRFCQRDGGGCYVTLALKISMALGIEF